MSEMLDIGGVASRLNKADNILIICHKNPDGETLGSAGALYWGLRSQGKTAAVFCSDPVHPRYDYMELELFYDQFEPRYVVAVDIAGTQLFGEKSAKWVDRIDMCIDHHGSNSGYADTMLLDETAAASAEIIYDLLVEMGVDIDVRIANCLYTGVSTDTGCFKFANTTARTHRVAARLIDLGTELQELNELLFENKSPQRIAVEQLALSSLEYHYNGCCALISLSRDQITAIGANEADLEGITSLPRSIEGVVVGLTMRQQPSGSYKVSVRTKVGLDATVIAKALGGGGHKQAAGCEVFGSLENAKRALLEETGKALDGSGLCPPEKPAQNPDTAEQAWAD
ncbi:bifunctional oligoribonuclease/PAP phosphatase NrnA [Ruminococcaceae bacterium OttesenSCG-928-D13]|nr:bifunctional oligoribonuclease/PAP phosphatase NrnA [Ruminococcaceae bacterium OttesenSCG-928-D13]